ncbi:docking domain of Afi1 for Arf3 in vesicle trafficking-domain-containing protein [Calycina marina]|uniref:Docking domain of Afi1 for Arf3 in vesicle trafficking-domain-containing protein n=1 Tax=Calycina marina TaxID=1763456 RepID=A0A9P8CH02_9HELO|nr:docking domain of Afi1 for Arf3 in vesicle trafficking-domain-containing protein [Calycina marina]
MNMTSSIPLPNIYYKSEVTRVAMSTAAVTQQQRPSTQGNAETSATETQTLATATSNGSANAINRRTSLSSFPSSRPPSTMSRHSRPSRSPNPPMIDTDHASDPSSNSKTPSSAVSSQNSSLSALRKYNPDAHNKRPLQSQYPRGEIENHVEYILVASFDIDKGPIMEHQYPVAITGDEAMLAELMLPDQAHVRNQDWTIFFLHKDTSQEEEEAEQKEERRMRRQRRMDKANGIVNLDGESSESDDDNSEESDEESSDKTEPEDGAGPPLIYVLNLVNTKQDKTAKRGAVVKAMAICTRHPFLHIYKPLLLLALDEYFKNPHPATLASLYEAVNTMDLSLMPKLSLLEKHLLQASDNKDLFVEKFEQMVQMRMAEDKGEAPETLAIMAGSPERRVDLLRNGTKAHVQTHSTYSIPRDTHEFETRVVYNGIPIPIKVPVAISPETVGDFSLIKLIQTFNDPHAKSPQPFALHSHLTTAGAYTHPIIVLANAMLTQKRVIFLGYNRPSGEVAEAVLAACALASGGILRGFTRHAFPYTDLSKIDDLLRVPGFIAGVTNPTFENHPEWWDVLCDLPTGRMKISNRIDTAPETEGIAQFRQQNPMYAAAIGYSQSNAASDPSGDATFMIDVLRSVAARHGEGVIRAKWRDWVEKFTRIAAAFEETVYGASALYIGVEEAEPGNESVSGHGYVWPDEPSKMKELAGGVMRIEGWRNTRSYNSFKQDLAQLYTFRPLKALDLHHLHDRLRQTKLTPISSREIYIALSKYTHSYDEICQLLTVAPESHAGLFYVALGLFHKDKDVRVKIVDLLERISEHEAGRHWWKALSRFEKLAYYRIKRQADAEVRGVVEAKEGLDVCERASSGLRGVWETQESASTEGVPRVVRVRNFRSSFDNTTFGSNGTNPAPRNPA